MKNILEYFANFIRQQMRFQMELVSVVGVALGLKRTQGRDCCQILTHINFAGGE